MSTGLLSVKQNPRDFTYCSDFGFSVSLLATTTKNTPGKAATRPAGPMPKKGAYLQENGEEAPVAPEAEAKGDESDDSDDSDADADDVDTAVA